MRCVVLTGAGRAFCAGGDVKGMAAGRDILTTNGSADNGERRRPRRCARSVEGLRASQRATSLVLHTMPKPTIAMVNGHAVGAGLSLALACDIRVASENAKLGTIFRNVGFSGDFGGSCFLQRLVGMGKARELYFTGEILKRRRGAWRSAWSTGSSRTSGSKRRRWRWRRSSRAARRWPTRA